MDWRWSVSARSCVALVVAVALVGPLPALEAEAAVDGEAFVDVAVLESGDVAPERTKVDSESSFGAPDPPTASGAKGFSSEGRKQKRKGRKKTGFDKKRSKRVDKLTSPTAEVFSNPDGTHTAKLSPHPMRFRDEAGKWKKIDLSLRRDGRGGFEPKSLPSGVRFPGDDAEGTGVVETSAGLLTIGVPDVVDSLAAPALRRRRGEAVYDERGTGLSVRMGVCNRGRAVAGIGFDRWPVVVSGSDHCAGWGGRPSGWDRC